MEQLRTETQHTIELNDGLRIPLIGLGTWPLTGAEATDAVARGIANGYRHVDTAHSYGNEAAVGAGIGQGGVDREHLWITSKLSLEGHSRTKAKEAYAQALGCMGLEYLDLLLIHWPNPEHGKFVQTCEGLAELVADGQLRAWGVSNFKPAHLNAVYAAGLEPAVNQIQVDPEHLQAPLLEHHRTLNLATVAYSPLGRAGYFLEHPAITIPAQRHGKSPAQIVLRWHVDSGRIAVPKSASDARQRENLDIFDFTLSAAELDAINSLDTGAGPRLDSDEYGH